jgi:hypothetical protein
MVVAGAAVRTAGAAGSAVVVGHVEALAAVGGVRRRLLVAADLMRMLDLLRATAVAAVITATAPAATAVGIRGIRSMADLRLLQRLLKAPLACLRETSSRSRA